VDDFGLVYFKARWLDVALGRFAQADTLIPGAGDSQAWDRYAFALNNPVRYGDPSGHKQCEDVDANGNCTTFPNTIQYDVTEFLVEEIQEAGKEGLYLEDTYYRQGGLLFVYSYMFGKYWRYGQKNIKEQMLSTIGQGVILWGSDGCRWVDYSTPGNILFGYAVEAAGISKEFYSWVGGVEQVDDDLINPSAPIHTDWCSTSYCDDPYDLAAVQFGAQLYKDYESEIITVDIFQNELTTDILDAFQPPPSSFVAPFSPYPQDNYYHVGNFDYGY